MLAQLSLQKTEDVRIGSPEMKGISGGCLQGIPAGVAAANYVASDYQRRAKPAAARRRPDSDRRHGLEVRQPGTVAMSTRRP